CCRHFRVICVLSASAPTVRFNDTCPRRNDSPMFRADGPAGGPGRRSASPGAGVECMLAPSSRLAMYQYNEFDKAFLLNRAAQFRDQIERWQDGRLSEDAFRPLRLQNGWYVQRHAPMLRVAVPYGELSSAQLRVLARVAREYDAPEADVYRQALD